MYNEDPGELNGFEISSESSKQDSVVLVIFNIKMKMVGIPLDDGLEADRD